jgi:hypothetical protein
MATVSELLDIARRQIGVKECPPNSNNVRYNTWYYGREVSGAAYPWCMVFVQWVFDQAGVKLPVRTASCGALMRAAKAAGQWVTGDYRPGDVVIYDFPGGAKTDHCGIVESVDGTYISAIEGNTSSASDADGGAVERRARKFSQIVGAVRPSYDKEVEEVRYNTVSECPAWARETVQKLVDREYLNGTGEGLDLSADMVRLLVILDRAGAFK